MQKYKISEYIGKKVKIISSRHSLYYLDGIIGKTGYVIRTSGYSDLGALVDNRPNKGSAYGVFWFRKNELEVLG